MTTPEPPPSEPQDEQAVEQIAAVLAAYVSAELIAQALSAVLHLPARALYAAIKLASRGTVHTPRTVGTGPVARSVAANDVYYRAAYIWNAAKRITRTLRTGVEMRSAVASEAPFYRAHEVARRNRVRSAADVDTAAAVFGVPPERFVGRPGREEDLMRWRRDSSRPMILGWYLGGAKTHTAECVAADGHNFRTDQRPAIGWPGTVHIHCQCHAGPPILGAGTVDQATAPIARRARKAG